jgi:Methyltransferase domain
VRHLAGFVSARRKKVKALGGSLGGSDQSTNYAAWFEGKEFTSDWLTKKLPYWHTALAEFHGSKTVVDVLEVGSYEGRSAVAFLEMLPASRLVAVDLFRPAEIEARFDRNLKSYGDRCEKIKGRAISVMDQLWAGGRRFDVVYLDAGKKRDTTFAQSTLAWPMLNTGGVLIWDDLRWGLEKPEGERPSAAIELFAEVFRPCMEELHRGQQLIVRKKSDWPSKP